MEEINSLMELSAEAVYVGNAGIILLAPFINTYFSRLGLLEGSEFRDELAAERAVHLLQYLASGQTETPEHLLVLNKVLCGVPIASPVGSGIDLTTAEADLSKSLLSAVLETWEQMKNSSIENLQGSFLLREGKLTESESSWQLTVEVKAYDILLDYIPWTYAMVKFAWMDKRIETAWE